MILYCNLSHIICVISQIEICIYPSGIHQGVEVAAVIIGILSCSATRTFSFMLKQFFQAITMVGDISVVSSPVKTSEGFLNILLLCHQANLNFEVVFVNWYEFSPNILFNTAFVEFYNWNKDHKFISGSWGCNYW